LEITSIIDSSAGTDGPAAAGCEDPDCGRIGIFKEKLAGLIKKPRL
jgi:hypothetical protein